MGLATALLLAFAPAPAGSSPLDAVVTDLAGKGFAGQVLAGDLTRTTYDRTVGMARPPRRWIWGSVSKQVTAALTMMEVDRGSVALDDTIARHLPGFPDPQGRTATLRQLLQHTSGLADPEAGIADGSVPPFLLRRDRAAGGPADAISLCAGPPAGERGRFSYNNCDTIVAAAMLANAAGRSFEALLATRILRPLGMTGTRLARPNEKLPFAASQAGAAPINIAAYGAAGALVGPATDLLRFDQALMSGKLMSDASRRAMWAGEPSLGYAALGAWSFAAPLKGCAAPVRLVERRGSVDGVQTRNILAPDLGRAVIVFTPRADFDFGEIWQGAGASYDIASAAFCAPIDGPAVAPPATRLR